MQQENYRLQQAERTTLARRAWTAYVRITVVAFVFIVFVLPLASEASAGLSITLAIMVFPFLAYRVLYIHSGELYYDEAGIWFFCGILPWDKGVVGVKWRDLDEAIFYQNFWSWSFRSHTIKLAHRFTKSNEILLTHMQAGDRAASRVNELHEERARQGRLH